MDFVEILSSLALDVPRKHHGRNPIDGFDCAGLIFWAYREYGFPLDVLDIPYTEKTSLRGIDKDRIVKIISRGLRDVSSKVSKGMDKDGDVWLFQIENRIHLGIYADGLVYHMADKLYIRNAIVIRAMMVGAYRA